MRRHYIMMKSSDPVVNFHEEGLESVKGSDYVYVFCKDQTYLGIPGTNGCDTRAAIDFA